jgi:2-keto-4-pentenoate hydratase/2-oxohepta-3-ene-1,7-dioic acid hydratase in catechol pathway
MKLACFDTNRIGLVIGDQIVDVTLEAGVDPAAWPPVGMVQVIANFDRLRPAFEAALQSAPRRPLAEVTLRTPVQWPNKIAALPSNFDAHIAEMGERLISTFKASGQGFFLKANSSLSGPADAIVLPDVDDREVHHECEFAIVIGKGGRDISREHAVDHVFGYACLVDMVIRGKEERVMRKAFDSFCPVGPWITTRDEAPAHDQITMSLSINGEVRQRAHSKDLIVDVPNMVAMASSVMTLYPGDIIASGTPAGVGPVQDGDVLHIDVHGIGEMTLNVVQGRSGRHPLWNKPN